MTAKEIIEEFLGEVRRATSSEIHDHVESMGVSRNASQLALMKLVNAGTVRRTGEFKQFDCWLAEDELEGLVFNAGTAGNRIFEQCRANCRLLRIDRLLASVRAV